MLLRHRNLELGLDLIIVGRPEHIVVGEERVLVRPVGVRIGVWIRGGRDVLDGAGAVVGDVEGRYAA